MNNTVKTDAPLGPSPTGMSYQEHLANVRAGEFAAKVNEGDCAYGLAKTTNAPDMPVVDLAAEIANQDTPGHESPAGDVTETPPYPMDTEERK